MIDNITKTTDINPEVEHLAEKLGVAQEIAAILFARGITEQLDAEKFLHPSEKDLTSPFVLENIDEVVERIREAIDNQQHIVIFGDYDCDGICATAILKLYFKSVGVECDYFIPTRADGYGLSQAALEKIADDYNPDLLITVDCGVTAIEEIEFITDVLGFDVIVTDHHEPYEELPQCLILNAKCTPDSPLRNICGAGLAFKLVEALAGREKAMEYIDIACLATLADVVPLIGENRIIASIGLKKINKRDRLGIKLLAESASIEKVTAQDIGFRLAPRINAAGRLGDAQKIVELFTSEEHFELDVIVAGLNSNNLKRQQLTKKVYEDSLVYLKDYDLLNNRIIILDSPQWESGILGIVAARLAEEFHRPTILFNSQTEFLKGSARSIDGVNIFECINSCGDLLMDYGGHYGAAGLTVNTSKYFSFRKRINEYIEHTYPQQLFLPSYRFDIEVDKRHDRAFFKQLAMLEPTGEANPAPLLALQLSEIKPSLLNGVHVKARLNADTDVMAFSRGYIMKARAVNSDMTLIGDANFRTYANRDYIQIGINDTVVTSLDNAYDSAESFGCYLKTALMGAASDFNMKPVAENDLIDKDGYYGNLYIAFSAETAAEFLKQSAEVPSAVISVNVGKADLNPLNRLLLCPDNADCLAYYERIVFLDAPLSTGYMKYCAKQTKGELLYRKKYAFLPKIATIDTTIEAVKDTYEVLLHYYTIAGRATDIGELYSKLIRFDYRKDAYTFITHFYTLFDADILKIEDGFNITVSKKFALDSDCSRVLKTINALKKLC